MQGLVEIGSFARVFSDDEAVGTDDHLGGVSADSIFDGDVFRCRNVFRIVDVDPRQPVFFDRGEPSLRSVVAVDADYFQFAFITVCSISSSSGFL